MRGKATVARVLIADDDDSIRETLRMLLEEEGHAVFEASSGREALQALHGDGEGCVALIDLVMPDMDGFELLEALKREPTVAQRHVIVVLSAGSETLIKSAEPLVATLRGFLLRKPFSIDDVTMLVNEAAKQLPSQ